MKLGIDYLNHPQLRISANSTARLSDISLRDFFAMSATKEDINVFQTDFHGNSTCDRFTARYKFADAMMMRKT